MLKWVWCQGMLTEAAIFSHCASLQPPCLCELSNRFGALARCQTLQRQQAWCKGTLSDSAEATALTCRLGMDVVQSELRAAGQLNLAACPPCLPSLMEAGASERGRAAAFAHHHR
eukprot:1139838-Pelagomonas_calceolata.AAC.4